MCLVFYYYLERIGLVNIEFNTVLFSLWAVIIHLAMNLLERIVGYDIGSGDVVHCITSKNNLD